jgi:hypothetical protein
MPDREKNKWPQTRWLAAWILAAALVGATTFSLTPSNAPTYASETRVLGKADKVAEIIENTEWAAKLGDDLIIGPVLPTTGATEPDRSSIIVIGSSEEQSRSTLRSIVAEIGPKILSSLFGKKQDAINNDLKVLDELRAEQASLKSTISPILEQPAATTGAEVSAAAAAYASILGNEVDLLVTRRSITEYLWNIPESAVTEPIRTSIKGTSQPAPLVGIISALGVLLAGFVVTIAMRRSGP